MSRSSRPRTALLLIDIQQGFHDPAHWGEKRSTPAFETNIAKLLKAFRTAKNTEILHVCHHSPFDASPLHPSRPGVQFMKYAAPLPTERVFVKTTNSPFVETDLANVIRSLDLDRLVVVGLMTAHCVATTLRMAANLRVVDHSYGCPIRNEGDGPSAEIVLVEDATATFNVAYHGKNYDAETVHDVHLATMKDEFCDIGKTNDVIRALDWHKPLLARL